MVKKGPNKDENVGKGPHMEKKDPHMVKKVPHKEKNVLKRPPHGKISSTFFQTCLRHKMAIDGGDSCRGGIIDKIRLGLYKYFRFS